MNTNQLQAALKSAQETVKHLTELIEGQEREPKNKAKTLEEFNIYPLSKEHYPEVKRVLEGLGYELFGKEWLPQDDCVTTTSHAIYMTHHYSSIKDNSINQPTYTFTEFMTKYSK